MTSALINKNEIIKVLQELINDYPDDHIPQDVIEKALNKVIGSHAAVSLNDNPALKQLEETLARAKAICPY